ncbi:MAG: multidrug efflux SMR transporter [Eggerthellales bacterium]|nr:multidrug efflux SMR transporter [Eggerthellales bacterium]
MVETAQKTADAARANRKVNPYLLLAVAIVFEVVATTCLKLSEGFTVPGYSLCVVVGYVVSLGLFVKVLMDVPLGLAYAAWGGIGTAATTVIGVLVWSDSFTLVTAGAMALIIGGIILMASGSQEDMEVSE